MINCYFPHSDKPSLLRHVTCDCIAVKDNQILLERRSLSMKSEPGKLALPGGYVNRDENISQAILRELKEETGYEGQIDYLLWISDEANRTKDNFQNVSFCFVVKVGNKVGEPDTEVSEIKWFDLDALPDESELAFDHSKAISLYKRYLKQKLPLPKIGDR